MNYRSLLIIGMLFLSACVPTTSSPHQQTSGGHTTAQKGSADLTIRDESTESEIRFSIREGNKTFSNYGISHTKEMHLIVVRDDLTQFSHLHPERDAEGVWHVDFKPKAGGSYWLYADFVEKNQAAHTIRFERTYNGPTGKVGIAENTETGKTVDGYRIALETVKAKKNVSFTYKITDAGGQRLEVEEYLGARGHSVLISPAGDFIHAHAEDEGEDPVFTTMLSPDTFYRAFTQFQVKGKVMTVDFDWQE